LGPADFEAVGLTGAGEPSVNPGDPGSAYIVYAGLSSATGGIELDVFVMPTEQEAQNLYDGLKGGVFDDLEAAHAEQLGVDAAAWRLDAVSGGPPFALGLVRDGRMVFSLGIPAGPDAERQLITLSQLVIERGADLR
jgi:hypothetical protein